MSERVTQEELNLIMLKVKRSFLFVLADEQSSLSKNDNMKMNLLLIICLVFTQIQGLLPGYSTEQGALYRH